MRSAWVVGLTVMLALVVNGCRKAATPPAPGQGTMFMAMLSGGEEVPAVETKANGSAEFTLSADGMELTYKLTVKDIADVTMTHLHMAAKGANGEDVVWLYPSPSEREPKLKEGVTNGVLAEGSIKADVLFGPMAGKTVKDLVDAMNAGNIYVQVHTKGHPEGEIRGQVMEMEPEGMGGM